MMCNLFSEIEILHKSGVNVVARGKRYGRFWLLKGLRRELMQSGQSRRRQQKEFEIHSRLLHPGVVKVVGVEEVDELGSCIVEEWVEGKTLSALLNEGNLDKEERRRILREIIEAVAYIHSRGVVHRDLKPTNIMVREGSGNVVIIDFGLADTGDYTELKQGAGTKGYISPEQQSSHGARETDDIYSLGVIIRELCPEYERIARSCTGSLDRRPKDCEILLRSIIRHADRPKIFWRIAGVIALICLGITAGFHFHSLHSAASHVNKGVEVMLGEARGTERKLNLMGDSLKGMAGTVRKSEIEIESGKQQKDRLREVYENGRRRLDEEMDDFEKRILPMFDKPDQCYYDSISSLGMRLQKICDIICKPERYPELQREELISLYDDLTGYFWTTRSVRMREWGKKLGVSYNVRVGFR